MINKFIIFILFFFPLIVFGGEKDLCVTKNKKAQKIYEQALEYLAQNNKQMAINTLKQAIIEEPAFVEAFYTLGGIYYQDAEKIFKKKEEGKVVNASEFKKADKNWKEATKNFEKVISICAAYENFMAVYYVGYYNYNFKNYKVARENLSLFVQHNFTDKERIAEARLMITNLDEFFNIINNPVPFNPKSLVGVSSDKGEFLPLISPDGLYAFYTRRSIKKDMSTTIEKEVDEFTVSEKNENASNEIEIYSTGKTMPSPFNDGRDQGGTSITINNKEMYLTICEMTKNAKGGPYTNCDIFSSNLVDGKWTTPQNLGTNINGNNTWEGQPSISADGTILYFASAREGNITGKGSDIKPDIYVSYKDKTGNWSKAQNLGSTINTEMSEKSPFIHSDSQTLYFSSDGHLSLGGFDIFFTRKNKQNQWEKPVNIGFPINTEDDDLGFSVGLKGDKAYFSSNKLQGKGGWDVYSFDLYEQARPEEVVIVKGQLLADDGNPIEDAEISVKNTKTAKITQGLVDKKTGEYAIALTITDKTPELIKQQREIALNTQKITSPKELEKNNQSEKLEFTDVLNNPNETEIEEIKTNPIQKENVEKINSIEAKNINNDIKTKTLVDNDYIITVKKEGYAFTSTYIKPKEISEIKNPVIKTNFEMKPIEVGKTIKLNNINYASNSSQLSPESMIILDNFSEFLQENPKIKIAIHGHTDDVGDDQQNLILSTERAKSVYGYLVLSDINPKRMTFNGFGETKPIKSNSTEEGRASNRRTEFVIVDK